MIYVVLINFTKHLFNICDPRDKIIYICIDGCVSINKINE